MERASKYYTLSYVVECKWPHNPFYEQIAAFNSDVVAKQYCDNCAKANPKFQYQVLARKGTKWILVHPA